MTPIIEARTWAKPAITSLMDGEFRRFQTLFYHTTGIMFTEAKRYFVEKRLASRLAELSYKTPSEYLDALTAQPAGTEMQTLINAMTVNETYFNREHYQFRALTQSILPQVTARRQPGERVRIWSIPCATGEEPYSLAIWLLENWSAVDNFSVEIVASDIDTDVLIDARKGLFSQRSVQHIAPDVMSKYFTRNTRGEYQLSKELRRSVEFTKVNLANQSDTLSYRNFDIVFCRNLLIYFDELSREKALGVIYDALAPGGFCCLGHSESMSRSSNLFKVVRLPDAIVYQKAGQAGR